MHLTLVILATLSVVAVPYGQARPSLGTFLGLHDVSADQVGIVLVHCTVHVSVKLISFQKQVWNNLDFFFICSLR